MKLKVQAMENEKNNNNVLPIYEIMKINIIIIDYIYII